MRLIHISLFTLLSLRLSQACRLLTGMGRNRGVDSNSFREKIRKSCWGGWGGCPHEDLPLPAGRQTRVPLELTGEITLFGVNERIDSPRSSHSQSCAGGLSARIERNQDCFRLASRIFLLSVAAAFLSRKMGRGLTEWVDQSSLDSSENKS